MRRGPAWTRRPASCRIACVQPVITCSDNNGPILPRSGDFWNWPAPKPNGYTKAAEVMQTLNRPPRSTEAA